MWLEGTNQKSKQYAQTKDVEDGIKAMMGSEKVGEDGDVWKKRGKASVECYRCAKRISKKGLQEPGNEVATKISVTNNVEKGMSSIRKK